MVFTSNSSDLESLYSLDSLEGETNINGDTRKNTQTKTDYHKNITIPYYAGEVLAGDIKSNVKTDSQNASAPLKSYKCLETKQQSNLGEEPKKTSVARASSYIRNDIPPKQDTSNKRISRRKELIVQNKMSLIARHRSVSYLDQFRKKHYGNRNLDSSSFSTAGSKLSDRDKSLSFISCLSGESSMSMSEFEFYDELIMSPRKEQLTWNKECLQSSTLLTEKSAKSDKYSKPNKVRNDKPVILSKIEVTIPDQQKSNLDKKRSIEKREMYANKVKLRNEMKINRQKERDRKNKFNTSSVFSNSSFEECLLQPQVNNVCIPMSDRKTSGFPLSMQAANLVQCSRNEIKAPAKDVLQKNKRRGTQSQNKKNKTTSELLRLQERHEREKSLIESMKNLILKT